MGPKSKGKGKGKLSKADKEKLKKEEAERKAQEEEEARIRAEQEEREREEKERAEREERRLFEEQERARHQAAVDELNAHLEANQKFLEELKQKEIENDKWNRYMLCDGRPDPTSKKDINTFINLVKEKGSKVQLKTTMKKIELIIELIDELNYNMKQWQMNYDAEEDTGNDQEGVENENQIITEMEELKNLINSYRESKEDLQKLIMLKLDEATWQLLKSPGNRIDPDNFNIQHIEESKNIRICLWGNAAKNPRVKQVEFAKDDFTMELPKQLALASIAVRVLYIKFDFLSMNCSTYAYKPKKKKVVPQILDVVEIAEPTTEGSEKEGEDDNINISKAMLNVKPSTAAKSQKGTPTSKMSVRKGASQTLVVNPSRNTTPQDNTTSTISTATTSERNDKEIEDHQKSEELEDDEDDYLDEDVMDLRCFAPIGPIIYIELLQLPPQAKEINGWIMQQVTSDELQKIQYGCTRKQSVSEISKSSVSVTTGHESSFLGYNLPICFSIRLDMSMVYHEQPQIARWDEESKHWRTSEISDVRYDEADKMMFFRTIHFGPFAVMHDIYLNMPFQSWQLRPTALNECILTVVGANTEIDIIIKENMCSVKFPEPIPQLSYLVGQWMKPQELITTIREVGLNIFPYEDGNKYVSICKKTQLLVKQLYQQMSLTASAFSYSWSKWNNDCGEEKVVIQAAEWSSPRIPPEEAYHLYMASTRICCKLNMIEYSQEFSTDVFPNSQIHADLYHMLQDGVKEETLKLMKDTSVVFIDCVHQLLIATNVFVYS